MEDAREVMFAMALSAFIMWFLNFLAHIKSANPKNFNQEADGAQTDASAVEVQVSCALCIVNLRCFVTSSRMSRSLTPYCAISTAYLSTVVV